MYSDINYVNNLHSVIIGLPSLESFIDLMSTNCEDDFITVKANLISGTKKILGIEDLKNHEIEDFINSELLDRILKVKRDKERMSKVYKAYQSNKNFENKERYKSAIDFLDSLSKQNIEKKYVDLLKKFSRFNESNFIYISEPFKADSDFVNVDLKVESENLNTCNIPKEVYLKK